MRELDPVEQDIADFLQSPVGLEIQEAGKEAFIRKNSTALQAEMDEIIRTLPPPLQWFMRLLGKL